MANSLLTGNIEFEVDEGCSQGLQHSLSHDENDRPIGKIQSNGSCIGLPTPVLKRPSEQKQSTNMKKRVSFDKASIERKRGKISRKPRRRRNVPVAAPLQDCFAVMAMFLFTVLLSNFLRDRQRQSQQDFLNRKAQSSKQKGGLSSRRKSWQQERLKTGSQRIETETTMDESAVSSEQWSQIESLFLEEDHTKDQQSLQTDDDTVKNAVLDHTHHHSGGIDSSSNLETRGGADESKEDDVKLNTDNLMQDDQQSDKSSSELPSLIDVSPAVTLDSYEGEDMLIGGARKSIKDEEMVEL